MRNFGVQIIQRHCGFCLGCSVFWIIHSAGSRQLCVELTCGEAVRDSHSQRGMRQAPSPVANMKPKPLDSNHHDLGDAAISPSLASE